MKASVAAAVGAGAAGRVAAQKDRGERETDPEDTLTEGAPSVVGDLGVRLPLAAVLLCRHSTGRPRPHRRGD